MITSVNIEDRESFQHLLLQLSPNTPAKWGLMNAQQMVEHMAEQVDYTNGTFYTTCTHSPDEAARRKVRMLAPDIEFPKGIVMNPPTDDVKYASIPDAIAELMTALGKFDDYYRAPGATAVHPGFGVMNHEEWLIWHNKHFTYHCRQFGLLPEVNFH